jgi:LPS-assembly protein
MRCRSDRRSKRCWRKAIRYRLGGCPCLSDFMAVPGRFIDAFLRLVCRKGAVSRCESEYRFRSDSLRTSCAKPTGIEQRNEAPGAGLATWMEIPLGKAMAGLLSFGHSMKTSRLLLVLALVVSALSSTQLWGTEEPEMDISAVGEGDVFYNFETGTIVVTNAFVARYADALLTADRGEFDLGSGESVLEGNVTLQRSNQIWRGSRIRYNFITGLVETEAFRTGRPPFFAEAERLTVDLTNQVYRATEAYVTTEDVTRPGVRVRARSMTIAPGRYFSARHAVFYIGGVPVFYLPYVRYNLDRDSNHFRFTPGYRSLYGPYLLGGYHWWWGRNLSGVVHLDYRTKRGLAGGPDVAYDAGRWGRGDVRFYYLHDQDPEAGSSTTTNSISSSRHRLYFTHQAALRPNLDATLAVRRQSDAYVTRDFLESEYRENPQPPSFLDVSQRWPNFTLSLLAQPRLNDFFETVERLPEIRLTAFRQQLGLSPFFYEGENSAGYYQRRFAANSPSNDFSAFRADTFHQVVVPITMFGWLNLTPRVGGRFTHYGETDGVGPTLNEQNRAVFNTGAELSLKASRLWPGARSRLLDLDGLRHIVQPAINYAYVPKPGVRPPDLPQFDTEHPTLRLLPVDFPDYHALDAIDAQNVLRLGLVNKIQTKRRDQLDHMLHWSLFTDWRLDRQPGQFTFADLYSDLDLKPRSWLILSSETRYDVERHKFRLAQHLLTLVPDSRWSWSLGHRYLRADPELGFPLGNNLFISTFYYRFSENWGVRLSHHYEARDGTLEEQYYTLYRDFRNWTGAITFRVRDRREDDMDYGVAATFSLKAFPRFQLGDDVNKPSLLLGN